VPPSWPRTLPHPAWPGARRWRPRGALPALEAAFAAHAGERVFGLGQYQHGALDHAGRAGDPLTVP
jgi:alpha-D-xyloside xylohydrolase